LAKCSGITQAGTACKGIPIDGSQWCYVHHPERIEERRRHGYRGGKRGGRGRPSVELARLQARFEELAEKVLSGDIERGVGAVAGQLLNGARACVRDSLAARSYDWGDKTSLVADRPDFDEWELTDRLLTSFAHIRMHGTPPLVAAADKVMEEVQDFDPKDIEEHFSEKAVAVARARERFADTARTELGISL
jgi:hypothetical protein